MARALNAFADVSGHLAAAATAQLLVAENIRRKSFFFQNNSAATMWLRFGAEATQAAPSLQVLAGGTLRMEKQTGYVDCSDISVIGVNAGDAYTALEA